MGTTQEKLSRLINTKNNIRQKLIDLGVDVPIDTPFEEYPELIKQLKAANFIETTTDQQVLQFIDLYNTISTDDYTDYTYTSEEVQNIYNSLSLILDGEPDAEYVPVELFDVRLEFIGSTRYYVGDVLDDTLYTAKVIYTDGAVIDVKDDCVLTPTTPLTEDDDMVTITYELDGEVYTIEQPISVRVYVPPLTVTREVLDQGVFKNVTPTYLTNQIDGSDGFTIKGRNSSSSSSAKHSGNLRWIISLDLGGWDTITFYAKKNTNHGLIVVGIEDNSGNVVESLLYVHYNDGPTSWTKYTVDISKYSGTQTVYFLGGYTDSTGSTSSSTSYCNIKFS